MSVPSTPQSTVNTVVTVVKPIPYSSTKDLETEVVTMLGIYQEKEGEGNWMKREKSLQRIRGLIAYGAHSDSYFQTTLLKKLQPAITESLLTLRTQLALQACFVVSDLAIAMKSDFYPFAESYYLTIMKVCAQTKKIVANAGFDTAITMIANVECPKLLPICCASLSDKNKDVRGKSAEFLRKMLEEWSTDAFLKNETIVEKAIKTGLSDASPSVREASRFSFWIFLKHFPTRASKFLNSLDSTTRKNVEKSKPLNFQVIEEPDEMETQSEESIVKETSSNNSSFTETQTGTNSPTFVKKAKAFAFEVPLNDTVNNDNLPSPIEKINTPIKNQNGHESTNVSLNQSAYSDANESMELEDSEQLDQETIPTFGRPITPQERKLNPQLSHNNSTFSPNDDVQNFGTPSPNSTPKKSLADELNFAFQSSSPHEKSNEITKSQEEVEEDQSQDKGEDEEDQGEVEMEISEDYSPMKKLVTPKNKEDLKELDLNTSQTSSRSPSQSPFPSNSQFQSPLQSPSQFQSPTQSSSKFESPPQSPSKFQSKLQSPIALQSPRSPKSPQSPQSPQTPQTPQNQTHSYTPNGNSNPFSTPQFKNRTPRTPSTNSPNFNWAEVLPSMILSIEQNTVQEDTFRKLTRLSKLNLEYIWSVHFNNILTSCLISLQIKDQSSIQLQNCLRLVQEMLIHQTKYFKNFETKLIEILLKLELENPNDSVKYTSRETLVSLISHLPLEDIFSVFMALLPQNPNQDSNEQLILFSLLSNVLSRYSKEGRNILDKDISILVPFLIQEMGSKSSVTRRASTEAIVQLRFLYKENFNEIGFSSLSDKQKLLIDIYSTKVSPS